MGNENESGGGRMDRPPITGTRAHSGRASVGWLYRTEGVPRYLIVEVNGTKETFSDSQESAVKAAKYITHVLDRDDWFLEDMQFLGYRIAVPVREG